MPIRNSISKASDAADAQRKADREAARRKRYQPQHGDKLYAMRLGKRFHVVPEPAKTVCGITFGGAFFVIHETYPEGFADIKPEHLCPDCFPTEGTKKSALPLTGVNVCTGLGKL